MEVGFLYSCGVSGCSLQSFLTRSQMSCLYCLRLSFLLSETGGTMGFLLTGSSLGLLNWARQGCLRASWAVTRLLGLNWSILLSRSSASAGTSLLNHSRRGLALGMVSESIIVKATSLFSDQMSLLEGFPIRETILSNWFSVEFPGKSGFPRSSSARMHPTDQISADFSQVWEPRSTSGARYQRVATSSVSAKSFSSSWKRLRASPKSQSLRWQSELMSMLEGLRSRWMMSAEWRYLMALRTWQRMKRWWMSLRIFWPMALCRSASMYSKIRQRSLSFSARITLCSFMMFSCPSSCRQQISRQVRCASIECWNASKIFLRARVADVLRSVTFHTWPQAPEPIFLVRVQRERIWFSTYSAISIQVDLNLSYSSP